jgi:hypothetical protein
LQQDEGEVTIALPEAPSLLYFVKNYGVYSSLENLAQLEHNARLGQFTLVTIMRAAEFYPDDLQVMVINFTLLPTTQNTVVINTRTFSLPVR